MKKHKIVWSGCPLDGSGYGKVSRDYIYWLNENENVDLECNIVTYTTVNPSLYLTNEQIEYYKKLHNPRLRSSKDVDKILINHITPDIAFSVEKYKVNALWSIWETNQIPLNAVDRCNSFDFIMTASEFSKNAFLTSGVTSPIEITPHIVTPTEFVENEKLESLTKDKITFLSVFEWHIGKGYDILIRGFIEAFKDNPNVILLLKVNSFINPFNLKEEVIQYIKSIKNGLKYPQIVPICSPVHENELNALYSYADCYVSCSRREGFSLTAAQAIVNNKLVIASDKGGHRQFLNENNSILVKSDFEDIRLLERERSNYRGQRWVEMDYDNFVNSLKVAYSYITDSNSNFLLEEEVNKVRDMLSPHKVVEKFLDIFNKYNI